MAGAWDAPRVVVEQTGMTPLYHRPMEKPATNMAPDIAVGR